MLQQGDKMLGRSVVILSALLAAGCSSAGGFRDVVVASRRDDAVAVRNDDSNHNKGHVNGKARGLTGVPKGHYPPPGECRLWYSGRPPGKQPAPAKCSTL